MVHKKLMAARMMLQNAPLKKSGHNKFAGYNYFELGDFIPTINQIFNEVGLCGVGTGRGGPGDDPLPRPDAEHCGNRPGQA